MLPPIPSTTLDANPLFASLYNTLTTKILDPADCSTRTSSGVNGALDQELRTHRAELAKTQLLQTELTSLTSRSVGLPEELQETLDLLLSHYYHTLPPNAQSFLEEEFEELEDNLPLIAHHVSTSLHKSALELARIVYPHDSPRALEQRLDSLPAETALRITNLRREREQLAGRLLSLTSLCCEILEVYHTTTLRLLQFLEQKSTAVPKALLAKSEHLSLVSESMSLKLQVLRRQALSSVYDPDAVNALENYRIHMTDTKTRLVARQRVAEEELRKYRNAGSDMANLVERYAGVLKRIQEVGSDIKRLGGDGL